MQILFASSHSQDPDVWINPLRQALPGVELVQWDEAGTSTGAELAIVWNPPETIFEREQNLRAVFNLGAGVDAILQRPGLTDKVDIYRLEDAGMAVQMAEYATWALLRASRRFDDYQRQQQEKTWHRLPDIQRDAWPVGVLGLGVMGSRVAQTLAGLDYPVAGWSRSPKQLDGVETWSGNDQFSGFLARSRVLINTLPLTSETHSILCRKTFEQLLPGACIINMGRGEHLVEADLLAMLDEGHIQHATLDVFAEEPLSSEHPFWTHPGVTVTPHMSAASLRDVSIRQTAEKIRAFIAGEPVSGLVERSRGY